MIFHQWTRTSHWQDDAKLPFRAIRKSPASWNSAASSASSSCSMTKTAFRAIKIGWPDDQGLFWCLYCLYWKNLTLISVISRHKTQVLGSLESLDKCLEVSQHQCCSYWFGVPTCWTNKKHHFRHCQQVAHAHRLCIRISTQVQAILKRGQLHLKAEFSPWFCWKNWSDHIIISEKKHGKSMGGIQEYFFGAMAFLKYIQCVFFKHIPSKQRHLGGQAFNNNEW